MNTVENLLVKNLTNFFRGDNDEKDNGFISNGLWYTVRGSGY